MHCFTSHEHTFPIFVIFQNFQMLFTKLFQTNGKYGIIVYVCTYQRPSQLSCEFFAKKMFDYDDKYQKVVQMLFIPLNKVG